ncbi:DKNYY domain-containing protein [Candidatus Uhrbacteria bacterium]|jgi:hypothetical protein|nr:DKNYY domain-containing protein [Candidatus Uhrbacteria bacterium]MBT7717352.1 DKNYY domain-containing protein [Candidatus Uhrbacteria bacterium]
MKIHQYAILMTLLWIVIIALMVVYSNNDNESIENSIIEVAQEVEEDIEVEVETEGPSEHKLIGSNQWTAAYYTNGYDVFYKRANSEDQLAILEGADLQTFETTSTFTARDAYHTYVQNIIVDLNSFGILNNYYSKDENYVYTTNGLGSQWNTYLGDMDAASFEVIDDQYAKDAYGVYGPCYGYEWLCMDEIEGADPYSFEIIGDGFSRDAYNLFFLTDLIEGADPNSFTLFEAAESVSNGYFSGKFYIDVNAIYFLDPMHEFRSEIQDISSLTFEKQEINESDGSSDTYIVDQYQRYIINFIKTDNCAPYGCKLDISIDIESLQ